MPVNPHVKGGADVPVTDGGTGSSTGAGGLANLGGLDAAAHAVINHAGIPGVGDLTTAAHGSLDHDGITGTARVMAAVQFGGDWGGGTDQFLRLTGDPGAGTIGSGSSGPFTRAYMPFAGEIVAVSWNSANSVSRQAQVLLNGSVATGFTFSLNTTHVLAPTPVPFSAGNYIEIFGNSTLGSGDPSSVSVLVWIRSLF